MEGRASASVRPLQDAHPGVPPRGRDRHPFGRVRTSRAAHAGYAPSWKEWLSSTAAASPSTPPTRSSSNRRNAHVGGLRTGRKRASDQPRGRGSVAVIDKAASAFRRLPDSFQGERVEGYGFDREALRDAGIERAAAFAAVTNGDNSNILAASSPNVRLGAGSRPHLRPAASGDLPAARRTHRPDSVMDHRPGAAAPRTRRPGPRVDRPDRRPVERELPARWVGRRLDELDEPETLRLVGVNRLGGTAVPASDAVGQTGTVSISRPRQAPWHSSTSVFRTAGGSDAGRRGAGWWERRPLHRQRTRSRRTRHPDPGPGSGRRGERWCRRRRGLAGRRRGEFSSLQQASLEAADVVVAATGDDEDNSLWPVKSSAFPGPSPGSTILGTSGCSTTWESTSPFQHPT